MRHNLTGILQAAGLTPEDAFVLDELITVLNRNTTRNAKKKAYYEDKHTVQQVGEAIPRSFKNLNSRTGWGAKAVDMLAQRSVFKGFTFSDGGFEELDPILRRSHFEREYRMGLISELIHGCGFWSVSQRPDGSAQIKFHSAEVSSAIWNYDAGRIGAGFVIADWAHYNGTKTYYPSKCYMFCDGYNIQLDRVQLGSWQATYGESPYIKDRPLIEPMVYKYSGDKPFGKSRITRSCMATIDAMERELQRTEYQCETFSSPQKYLFNVQDGVYDSIAQNKAYFYSTSLLVTSENNETGSTPQLGQLAQPSMTPHIEIMEFYANKMSAETNIPASAFGIAGKTYQSSDALRAASDDIILEAKALNEANAEAMVNVARMALAIERKTNYNDVLDDITVHWADPAMTSPSIMADTLVKEVSSVPEFAGTSVYWERAGYDRDEIARINTETKQKQAQQYIQQALFGDKNAIA